MLLAGSRLVPGYHLKSDGVLAGRYRVDRVLGRGQAGFVVAARHIQTNERVALKVLTQPGARTSTHVVAALRSPHVARIVETGRTEDGDPFIATELLEGESLEGRTFPAATAVSMIVQACAGLAEAHAKGVVHGDLKPSNLFLTADGTLKILDFGMVMALGAETEEASAAWFASPAYLAPEQLREPAVDAKADVWALGVILHHLVAGKLPFQAETIAGMFVAVAYDEPAMLAAADVPYALAKIVHRCLAKQSSQRPSASELASLLAPFADHVASREADSLPPMAIEATDVLATSTAPGLGPSNIGLCPEPRGTTGLDKPTRRVSFARMTKALQTSSSRPPPLPASRLGSRPKPPRLPSRVPRAPKGWLANRLREARFTATRLTMPHERDFDQRRLGAVGVIVTAAAIGIVSLFASPSPSPSETRSDEESTVLGAATFDLPADAAALPFVPASFALPEREEARAAVHPAPEATATVVHPMAPRRPRLSVRQDPYAPPGFTHPSKLR